MQLNEYHLAFSSWRIYLSEKEINSVMDERELTQSERDELLKFIGMADKVGKVDAFADTLTDSLSNRKTYNNNRSSTYASFSPREMGNPSTPSTNAIETKGATSKACTHNQSAHKLGDVRAILGNGHPA